jgi:hypothetical protein
MTRVVAVYDSAPGVEGNNLPRTKQAKLVSFAACAPVSARNGITSTERGRGSDDVGGEREQGSSTHRLYRTYSVSGILYAILLSFCCIFMSALSGVV